MSYRNGLRIVLILGIVIVTVGAASCAFAANDVWDNTPGGNWGTGANWTDGSTPGINDTATFNLAQAYPVTFAADPGVIQGLSVIAGTVMMQSSGGAQTLHLTAGAGNQDIVVSGAATMLTLGAANNPLSIVAGDDLSVQAGATLAIVFGSGVTANDLSVNGLNGILRVDGSGSTLTLGGTIANLVGGNSNGSLVLQNGSTGNTINAALGLAGSATPGVTGSLSILAGSTLNLGGNLMLADQNVTGQVGTLSIDGTNSGLTQTGASTITVGSAANGTATIAIGTTTSGGTFSSGTGLFTINKTGTVTIGGGTNVGSLLVNGDLTINGGVLQKSNAASTFDLAAGRTVIIAGGGRLTLAGATTADANQIFNVSDTNSRLEITGTETFSIGGGAQVNLSSGAVLAAGGRIDVANGVGGGTLMVAGNATTATAASGLSAWASSGGSANVSFSDKAVGAFSGGIDLANSAVASTTAIVDVLSGAKLNTGSLSLATSGGTTTAATLNIHGTDSGVLLAGAAMLTVGHASEGTATINVGTISDGGIITSGSGLFQVNKTGTVNVGAGENGGTLEVVGDILVDGGAILEGSEASVFAWAANKTFTVQNGGRAHFASSYTTANSSQHVITGANSRFEVVDAVLLRGAAQIGVGAGGTISAGEYHVGGMGTPGSFIVDGVASHALGGGGESHWGNGGAASITFSNQAAVTLNGGVHLAETAATTVQVLSAADFTLGDLSVAAAGGTASGTLNVLGMGSTVNLGAGSNLTIGHATSGTGSLNIDDAGCFAVSAGGTTIVNGTGMVNIAVGTADLQALSVVGGTVNVNGGKLVFSTLAVNGGQVKLNSGRIEQSGNLTANDHLLTTLLGPTHELGLGRTIAAGGGTATVSANLDLNGGRLEGNSLAVTNAGLTATTLRIRSGGTAQVTAGATLAAGTTTLIETGGTLLAGGQLTQASELQLTGTGRVAAATLANTGLVTGSGRIDANLINQPSGQLRIANGKRILINGTSHTNNGLMDVDGGELEIATGAFVNGTGNPATATIAARNAALRFSGGVTNAGSILCSEGTCNFFGPVTNVANQPATGRIVITASSQATFFDDVINQGTIQVSAAGVVESTALFLGSLTGNGVAGSGSVFLEGDVRPGVNIGTMAFGGDVSLGSSAVVKMELGGTTPGTHYDRITVAQSLALGGALELTLTNGFSPAAGQSFDLFDWGSRSGTFASLSLPALPGLAWNTSQLYSTGVVSFGVSALPGDFNSDGTVDAADYTVWRDSLGSIYTQADFNVWKLHFGQSVGGDAVAMGGANGVAAIPEPGTGWLMSFGAGMLLWTTRQQARQRASRCTNRLRAASFRWQTEPIAATIAVVEQGVFLRRIAVRNG